MTEEAVIRNWMRTYITEPQDAVALQLATAASDMFPDEAYTCLVRQAIAVLRELRDDNPPSPTTFSLHTFSTNPVHTRFSVYNRGGCAGDLCINTSDAAEFQRRIDAPNQVDDIAIATRRMKAIAEYKEREEAHIAADKLMCNVLMRLGYEELVDIYTSMERWYA